MAWGISCIMVSSMVSYLCNGEWLGEYFVGGHNLAVAQPGADLWRVNAQQLHHDGQVFVLHLQQSVTVTVLSWLHSKHSATLQLMGEDYSHTTIHCCL